MSTVYSSGKEQALFRKEHGAILSLIFNQRVLLIFQVEGLYLVKKVIQQNISPLLFLFGDSPYRPITAKLYFVTLEYVIPRKHSTASEDCTYSWEKQVTLNMLMPTTDIIEEFLRQEEAAFTNIRNMQREE